MPKYVVVLGPEVQPGSWGWLLEKIYPMLSGSAEKETLSAALVRYRNEDGYFRINTYDQYDNGHAFGTWETGAPDWWQNDATRVIDLRAGYVSTVSPLSLVASLLNRLDMTAVPASTSPRRLPMNPIYSKALPLP
jgi:hypothetical protein